VHRDIKPANIHLGQDGALRILDLGVALSLGEDKPTTRSARPARRRTWRRSCSPALPAGPAHDLYAAGVTLYHLLTRKYPYGEIEPFQQAEIRRAGPPDALAPGHSRLAGERPAQGRGPRSQGRFETAEEFLLALERGASRPLTAQPTWRTPLSLVVTPLAMRNPLLTWRIIAGLSLAMTNLLLLMLVDALTVSERSATVQGRAPGSGQSGHPPGCHRR
jgi:serine/threonine protein kinase